MRGSDIWIVTQPWVLHWPSHGQCPLNIITSVSWLLCLEKQIGSSLQMVKLETESIRVSSGLCSHCLKACQWFSFQILHAKQYHSLASCTDTHLLIFQCCYLCHKPLNLNCVAFPHPPPSFATTLSCTRCRPCSPSFLLFLQLFFFFFFLASASKVQILEEQQCWCFS